MVEMCLSRIMDSYSKYNADANLFIKNLNSCIEDAQLYSEFSKFGTIISARIMRNEDRSSKGFGFVLFTTAFAARTAISEMNGRILAGKPIYVAIAQRKDERKLLLQKQFNKAKEADMELEEMVPTGNSEFLKRRILNATALTEEPSARQIKHSMVKKLRIGVIYPKIADKIENVLIELGGAELSRMISNPDLAKKKIDGIALGIYTHCKR